MRINKISKTIAYAAMIVFLASMTFMHSCEKTSCVLSKNRFDINNLTHLDNIVPVLIIGSGVAGWNAAVYSVYSKTKTTIMRGPRPGGLLTLTTTVENYPGFTQITGPEIIKNLEDHAQHLGQRFAIQGHSLLDAVDDAVDTIDVSSWPYTVTTKNGVQLHALSLIITSGADPKLLGVPGEQEYFNKGVATCAVCDAAGFVDKEVVVVGGGDSAIEEATHLAKYAKKVTILVRKESMRASPSMQDRLPEYPSIQVIYNVEVKKVVGNGTTVTGVELYDNKTGQTSLFATDGMFLAIGHVPNSAFKVVDTDDQGYIIRTRKDGREQTTSVPGIFVAGDVTDHVYRQARVAEGQGYQAGMDAVHFLTSIGYSPKVAASLEDNFYYGDENTRAKSAFISVNTDEQFAKEVEQVQGYVFAEYSKEGCIRCKDMEPMLEEVAQFYSDKMKFVKVDVSDKGALESAYKYHVRSLPGIIIFRDGKLVARSEGYISQMKLMEMINQVLEG